MRRAVMQAFVPLMGAAVMFSGCKSKELIQQCESSAVHSGKHELNALSAELKVREITLDSAVIRITGPQAVTEVTAARIRLNDSVRSHMAVTGREEHQDSVRTEVRRQERSTPATATHRGVWSFAAGVLAGMMLWAAAIRLYRAVH